MLRLPIILTALVAGLTVFSVCGCSGGGDTTEDNATMVKKMAAEKPQPSNPDQPAVVGDPNADSPFAGVGKGQGAKAGGK